MFCNLWGELVSIKSRVLPWRCVGSLTSWIKFFAHNSLHSDTEKSVDALCVDQLMSGQLKSPTRTVSLSVLRELMLLSTSCWQSLLQFGGMYMQTNCIFWWKRKLDWGKFDWLMLIYYIRRNFILIATRVLPPWEHLSFYGLCSCRIESLNHNHIIQPGFCNAKLYCMI